jgi:hypothetical protein
MKKKIAIGLISVLLVITTFVGFKAYTFYNYKGELIRFGEVYHRDSCKFVKDIPYANLKFVKNIEATAELNLRPCRTCTPPNNEEQVAFLHSQESANVPTKAEELWNYIQADKTRLDRLNDTGKKTYYQYGYDNGYLKKEDFTQDDITKYSLDFSKTPKKYPWGTTNITDELLKSIWDVGRTDQDQYMKFNETTKKAFWYYGESNNYFKYEELSPTSKAEYDKYIGK